MEKLYQRGTKSGTKWKDIAILNGSLQQKSSRETNVQAAFCPSWGEDKTWFNTPITPFDSVVLLQQLLRYILYEMFQINASLFGKKSLFTCKSLLLFHYFSVFHLWPCKLILGKRFNLWHRSTIPTCEFVYLHHRFCVSWLRYTVVGIFFLYLFFLLVTWNILSHLKLDLLLCSSICQLCAVDSVWVVGQSYNSHSVRWSNPITELLCPHSCVSPVSSSFWSL